MPLAYLFLKKLRYKCFRIFVSFRNSWKLSVEWGVQMSGLEIFEEYY